MDSKTLEKIKVYVKKVSDLSDDKRHDFGHAERVTRNAMWILDTLKIGESVDRNLLQAACYLHDVVVMKRDSRNYFSRFVSHFFEKNLNKKYLGKVLADFDLPWEEDQIIAEAIINHPNSIPFLVLNKEKDIYSKILQDADSLDYASSEREVSFGRGKGIIQIYIARKYLSWIRNHMERYLNFPELIK